MPPACASVCLYLLLGGCSEYDVKQRPEPEPGADTAPPIDTAPPPPDCSVTLAEPGTVPIDKTCQAPEIHVEDPWSVAIEWTWRGLETDTDIAQVMMLPAVGNLTDDDGDGLVTEEDIPDVVAIAFDGADGRAAESLGSTVSARLVLISGDTGETIWERSGFYWKGGPAVADINGDGQSEIVAITSDRRIIAVDGRGEDVWISSATTGYTYPHANVADVDADGSPEVLVDELVLSGSSGALKLSLSIPSEMIGRMTVAADIDLDGQQEIIAGNTCYSSTGAVEWQSPLVGTYGHWAAILNADEDDYAEVIMVGEGELILHEHDGTQTYRVPAGTTQPGPPCVADFDGDEQAEIAWASSSRFNVYELDGTVLWTQSIVDASGLAGCAGYDVDGDGAYEVIYADERQLYIFDGSTGAIRFVQPGHASGTIFEYPVIADVDNDDSAEIVFVSNNFRSGLSDGWAGVTALGHSGDGWARSGPTWNIHDFAVTNIEQNGRVPRLPEPAWQVYNVYRARPAEDLQALDLYAEITDVCIAACEPDSIVRVAIQVSNQGATRARAGIPVALYRRDGSSRVSLGLVYTEEALDPGTSSAGLELEIRLSDIGADGLEAWADDVGAGFGILDECDNWNNNHGLTWNENTCP